VSRRALFGYLLLNVLVTFTVMLGVLLINEARLSITPTPVRNLLPLSLIHI